MNKIKSITLTIVIFCSFIQGQDAVSVMERIQKKFGEINNFTADFIQTASSSGLSTSFKMSGKFFYKKTNHFKIESEKMIIVSDGETIWNYSQEQNRVVINNVSDDPSAFTIENYIYEYPENCELKLLSSDRSQTMIRLTPKNTTIPFNHVDLSVNKNWLVEKIEILDLNNSNFTIELKRMKINTNLSNNNFEFSPPEGSKIIDLR